MTTKIKKPTRGVPLWVFVLVGVVVVIVAGWKIVSKPAVVEIVPEAPLVRRAIDGVWVSEGTPEHYPLVVIIENSIDAWPISGIAQANLVWEAPTEAGITRLLATFADGRVVDEIGPVRSTRPYFIDWAEEVHALLAHVGGSPEALATVSDRVVIDLNEFWNGGYFWRNGRARPHNVYTSTERLQEFLEDEPEMPTYESWPYQDEVSSEERGTTRAITVVFGNDPYTVTWKYDSESNDYVRFQLGELYRDAEGVTVRAKNVVVMETDIEILDEIGRRKIKTIGNGPVRVFRDGLEFLGEWRRGGRDERTKFYDVAGVPIPLNAGSTWIAVTDVQPTVDAR